MLHVPATITTVIVRLAVITQPSATDQPVAQSFLWPAHITGVRASEASWISIIGVGYMWLSVCKNIRHVFQEFSFVFKLYFM